jgi:hypothetical protein
MAIALRGSPTTATGTGADLVVNCPTGVVAGDVLIAWESVYNSTSYQTPSGWTRLFHGGGASGSYAYSACYYKVAGSSEPATYTFSTSNSGIAKTITLTAWTGVDNTNPINIYDTGTTNKVSPTITTTIDNCIVLTLVGSGTRSGTTYTAPGGTTGDSALLANNGAFSSNQSGVAHFTQASAGATGTKTWTASTIDGARNGMVALTPGAEGIPFKLMQGRGFGFRRGAPIVGVR